MQRGTLLSLLSLTIGGWMMSSNADRATTANPEDPVPLPSIGAATGIHAIVPIREASSSDEGGQGPQVHRLPGSTRAAPHDRPPAPRTPAVEELQSAGEAGSFHVAMGNLTIGVTYRLRPREVDGSTTRSGSSTAADQPRSEIPGDIALIHRADTARSVDIGSSSMTASRLSRAAVPSRSVHGDRVSMAGQNAAGVQDPDCVSDRGEIDTAPEWSASYRNACDSVAALARHACVLATGDRQNAEVWIVTLDTLDFGTTGPPAHGSRRGGDTEQPGKLVVRQSSP